MNYCTNQIVAMILSTEIVTETVFFQNATIWLDKYQPSMRIFDS